MWQHSLFTKFKNTVFKKFRNLEFLYKYSKDTGIHHMSALALWKGIQVKTTHYFTMYNVLPCIMCTHVFVPITHGIIIPIVCDHYTHE